MYDAMNLKSIYKDATDVIDGYKKKIDEIYRFLKEKKATYAI